MRRSRLALLVPALALVAAAPSYALTRAVSKPIVLVAKVGKNDGYNITLTKGGIQVQSLRKPLKHGAYTILVHDYSDIHNIRLKGPGINKSTTVPGIVDTTWKINLRKGAYTVVCDPHAMIMKFAFKVT